MDAEGRAFFDFAQGSHRTAPCPYDLLTYTGADLLHFGFDKSNPYVLRKSFCSNLVDKKTKKNNLKGIIWEVTFS